MNASYRDTDAFSTQSGNLSTAAGHAINRDPTSGPRLGSRNRPIDLTQDADQVLRSRVRTWQPDSDANECFLCLQRFSLLYRRHHCRLCGRVCCASCSPHRIVVPASFVVRPETSGAPEDHAKSTRTSLNRMVSADGHDEEEAVEVRICDECLDRPATDIDWRLPGRLTSRSAGHQGARPFPQPHRAPQRDGNIFPSSNSYSASSLGHNSLQQAQNYPSQLYSSSTEDSPSSNSARSLSSSQALAGFGNQLVFRDRNLSPSYVNNGRFGFDDTVASEDNSRAGINDNLKETDFCPICSRRLPAPDPATGSEASREMHIQDCIRRAENPATDTMNAWHDDTAGSPLPGSNNQSHTPSATRRAARRCRMVIYEATTKDTHQDGEELECVICFEGFKVGEPVARLDCFCRYHKNCIQEWFNKKGDGDCPVHFARV